MFPQSALLFHTCFFIAERVGVNVVECACVIELPELKVQFQLKSAICVLNISFHSVLYKPIFVN